MMKYKKITKFSKENLEQSNSETVTNQNDKEILKERYTYTYIYIYIYIYIYKKD